jgi:serralysin
LIGGPLNDQLYGGRGSDKYDGAAGNDLIWEDIDMEGTLVNNDEIISGGPGNDQIVSGPGADKIHAGPGNDWVFPDTNSMGRDFSVDSINCGADTQDKVPWFHSADGDTIVNCEVVDDLDR